MEGIDKPHTDKYKEIMNYSNYDGSCTLTSLPVWDLENFKCLIFVVQSVPRVTRSVEVMDEIQWRSVHLGGGSAASLPEFGTELFYNI
jgi:hypothetical protein